MLFSHRIVAAAFIAADEDVCNDGLEQIFGRKHGFVYNTWAYFFRFLFF